MSTAETNNNKNSAQNDLERNGESVNQNLQTNSTEKMDTKFKNKRRKSGCYLCSK